MDKATEYFGLLMTELRNTGHDIVLSDSAAAELIANALEIISPDEEDAVDTAAALYWGFATIAEQAVSDNGS